MRKSVWKQRAKRLQDDYDLFIKPIPESNPYYAIQATGVLESKVQVHTITRAGGLRVDLVIPAGATIYTRFYTWIVQEGSAVVFSQECHSGPSGD